MSFVPPSLNEIVGVLEVHPLILLREKVKRGFLVGSFAKGLQRPRGSSEGESDVDILLEVEPRRGFTAAELEDHYRRALRQFFVSHGIRGKADDVHPQWDGRRVDLYFTYDADQETRPMQPLRSNNGGFGAWGREAYKFTGTADVVDTIRDMETDTEFDALDDLANRERNYNKVYCGRNVCWAANRGKMVQIPRANINFMEGNQWNMEYAASIYRYLRSGGEEPLRSPAGRIHRVTAADVKMSEKYEAEGELEYQLGMTEPWTRDEIGQYEAQLVDGNHRAAAAMALGEPYIWVYIAENSLDEVLKKDRE